jgi:CysZ protein
VRGVVGGVRLLFSGMRLLFSQPRLWALASVPLALSMVAVFGAGFAIHSNAGAIHEFLTAWLPAFEVTAWYTWIWMGPARLIAWLMGGLLFAMFVAASLLLSLLVSNVLSAPFLDALSLRTEAIESGEALPESDGGLRALLSETRRSMANELQRALFFIGVWLLIALGGVLIPGGAILAPPLLMAFTAIFLPLDYAGYSLDRRHVSFAGRRNWIRANLATMIGFGGAALAISLVPGLNFLLLPTLVIAGTLLALRCPPDSELFG